jgi:hypothetical protein
VGFSEPEEEILAVTAYHDHPAAWRSYGIYQRISDRAAHLHIILARNTATNMDRGAE